MKIRIILVLLFSFWLNFLFCQVQAPELLCLDDETIQWNPPSNSCGNFIGYQIFWSNTLNGPFQLLTTISDANQSSFLHANPFNEDRFYYMTSDYDCPGEDVLHSDTISTKILDTPLLQYVSVEGNEVKIKWQPSSNPATKFYIIYKVQSLGTFPIDTVTTTEYIDVNSDSNNQSDVYFVIGLDPCNNKSIFGDPHFTTFVESNLDSCTNEIHLMWNPYLNSLNEIDHQEIWINDNGWKLWGNINSSDSTFIVKGLTKDSAFELMIKSVEKNTNFIINSNTIDIFTNPLADLTITNVTISPSNDKTTIDWVWNSKINLKNPQLIKNNSSTSIVGVPDLVNSVEDAETVSSSATFQLMDKNGCKLDLLSNQVSSIFLSGNFVDLNTNNLSWTPFSFENATFQHYEVFRNNEVSPISTQTEQSFLDNQVSKTGQSSYYIVAVGEITSFDGVKYPIQSRSNTITIFKKSDIFFPNAFAPLGNNRFFKPVILSPENVSGYEMYIFDRWGKEIFFSNDIELGWDGYYNGRLMTPEVYSYIVRLTQNGEDTITKKGVVMLVH